LANPLNLWQSFSKNRGNLNSRVAQNISAHDANAFMQQVLVQARQMTRSFDLRLDAGYTIGSVRDELTRENVWFCGPTSTKQG